MEAFASGVGVGRLYYTVLDGVEVADWLRGLAERFGLGFARVEAHGGLVEAVVVDPSGARRVLARTEAVLVTGFVIASPGGVDVLLWGLLSVAGGDCVAGRLVSAVARGLHTIVYELPGHHEAWRLAKQSLRG